MIDRCCENTLSGGFGVKGHSVAHGFEAAYESLCYPGLAAFVEIVRAEFLVFPSASHEEETSNEQAVRHGDGRFARTTTPERRPA